MSLNLFVHAIGAVLWVWFLAHTSWKRVLKNWQPERRPIRYIMGGFLMVTIAGVGWVYLIGPTSLKPFLVANGLFALAFMLGLWTQRAHS